MVTVFISVFIVDDQWSKILRAARQRLKIVLLPPSAWGVLSRQVYESSVCLEDMRKVNDNNEDDEMLPSATLTRDLRKRFYGVLLFENRKSDPIVKEFCAENERSYQKSVRVAPEYPKGNVYYFCIRFYSTRRYFFCLLST